MEKKPVNQCRGNMSATPRKAEEGKGAETERGYLRVSYLSYLVIFLKSSVLSGL